MDCRVCPNFSLATLAFFLWCHLFHTQSKIPQFKLGFIFLSIHWQVLWSQMCFTDASKLIPGPIQNETVAISTPNFIVGEIKKKHVTDLEVMPKLKNILRELCLLKHNLARDFAVHQAIQMLTNSNNFCYIVWLQIFASFFCSFT